VSTALAPFESDLLAALEISDPDTRSTVLDLLVKAQARDRRGRWTSGGGGGAGAADGGGGDGAGGGGGGSVTAAQAREALLTNLDVTMAPGQVDGLMKSLAGGKPVNLEHLQVTGKGNENMFARHATETPRSKMPQLPETVAGMRGFTDDLAARGVKVELRKGVDPRSLHATQNELDGAKVGSIYGYIRGGGWQADSVIIASREGAVVDGHHRWAAGSAARVAGMDFGINVLQVDMGIEELLDIAQSHSGERRGMGAPLAVPKSLSLWEQDMWAALEISDAFTRGAVLELLSKEQSRDELGRFGSGGGSAGGAASGTPEQLHDDDARIREVFEYTDEATGLSVGINAIRRQGPGFTTYVSADITDRDGNVVGGVEREIRPAGQKEVSHGGLVIDEQFQGQGFATRYNARLEDAYRAHGIERIRLNASLSVGGYAWAKAGYNFDSSSSRMNVADRARELGRKFSPDVQAKIAKVADNWRASPIEFAMIGWQPGATTWPGKQIMLGATWSGVKEL